MNFIYFILAAVILGNSQMNSNKELPKNDTYPFYVGTYTDKESEGIYKYLITADGRLKKIGLVAKCKNPAFLAKSADNKYLLAVNEINNDGYGAIESYLVKNDTLLLINQKSSGGAYPCFVTINNDRFVLVANYNGGNIGLFRLNNKGKLSSILYVEKHLKTNEKIPHTHSAWFEPFDNSVITIDKGRNELWFSHLDTSQQKLVHRQTLEMDLGSGPRHLVIHPNGRWIYVLNELNNSITFVKKLDNGKYIKEKSFSTLPIGYTAKSICADIKITSNGKFIYATNRVHNSIAIFEVDSDSGELNLLGLQPTFGDFPRNISLSPDENYLIVANRNSNNIASFKRNKISGMLKIVDKIEVPTPACIVF